MLAAESGRTDEAIELLTKAIQLEPFNYSLLNDRAQAEQLTGNTEAALSDLNMAIELSKGKGRTAAKSFAQRGTIFQVKGDENSAMEDFKKAAALGNEFAKRQLVL